MNREAVIEFVLEHYRAENQGRVDYDECFGDHLECLVGRQFAGLFGLV